MVEETGELRFESADYANVPVDIRLFFDEDKGVWKLSADNYMPRRGRLVGDYSYEAWSDSRIELVNIVKKHILPLYQTAVSKLMHMCEPQKELDDIKTTRLYYWDKNPGD